MSRVEASALWHPTLHGIVTVVERVDSRRFDDVGWQKIRRTHHTFTEKVATTSRRLRVAASLY